MDLLRSLTALLGIAVLAGIGLLAHATAAGVEIDAVGAGRRLPHAVLSLLTVVAPLVLLLLPVALAVRQLSRRQPRQLAEAVLTGVGAMLLVALVNAALRTGAASQLFDAIAPASRAARLAGPLDGYLAGLIAYTTIIGLTSSSPWRTGLWVAIGIYGVASLAASQATVLSLLITLLLGRVIGLGVRYAIGSLSQRPTAEQIATALASAGQAIAVIRRARLDGTESRRYTATAPPATTSTSGSSTATRKRPERRTGSTGGHGSRGRRAAASPCRWNARPSARRCCPTPRTRRASGQPGCARSPALAPTRWHSRWTVPQARPWPSSPNRPDQAPGPPRPARQRYPSPIRAQRSPPLTSQPMSSCGGSGTPSSSCTPTASRTGR